MVSTHLFFGLFDEPQRRGSQQMRLFDNGARRQVLGSGYVSRVFFPKPYRESTVRQLQDTALAQQKGGLPSADALELSLQTCTIDEIILYRGFFIRYSAKRLFPHKLLCMVYPSLPGLPNSLFAILDSSGTAGRVCFGVCFGGMFRGMFRGRATLNPKL